MGGFFDLLTIACMLSTIFTRTVHGARCTYEYMMRDLILI